ncbi:MAG: hypothetical protein ACRCT6_09280, partial [Notoacmeibacter sp.]
MDQDQNEPAAALDADLAKKTRKAEIKTAEKAKKAAKAEKKLAKQAEKSAKDAEKAQRKLEKQQRKGVEAAAAMPDAEPEAKPVKKAKAQRVKATASVSMSLGAKLQAVARLARSNLASGLLKHGLYAGQEQVLFLLD